MTDNDEKMMAFKDGVSDALLNNYIPDVLLNDHKADLNERYKHSAFYKSGYDFGIILKNQLKEIKEEA